MAAVTVLHPRDVPLGGLRAMNVRRTLPHRDRSFIGAWCFADHYGPMTVGVDGPGMDVPPHPHTGLQTVSWLFEGEIEHRDSAGVVGMVRPGEVNLMTGGSGICHSEVATPATTVLHGVQLWVALPDAARHGPRDFHHYAAPAVPLPDGVGSARVFVGALVGVGSSPVPVHSPLLGAELILAAGAEFDLEVNPEFEHGVLVDRGRVWLDGFPLEPADLGGVDAGPERLRLRVGPEPARVVVLGGAPFDEDIVMWWNFVGRSHDEIVECRNEWEAHSDRFGAVAGYHGATQRIPAPPLPGGRLKARGRLGRRA